MLPCDAKFKNPTLFEIHRRGAPGALIGNFELFMVHNPALWQGGVVASELASHALGHRFEHGLVQCHLERQALIGKSSFESFAKRCIYNKPIRLPAGDRLCCREISQSVVHDFSDALC